MWRDNRTMLASYSSSTSLCNSSLSTTITNGIVTLWVGVAWRCGQFGMTFNLHDPRSHCDVGRMFVEIYESLHGHLCYPSPLWLVHACAHLHTHVWWYPFFCSSPVEAQEEKFKNVAMVSLFRVEREGGVKCNHTYFLISGGPLLYRDVHRHLQSEETASGSGHCFQVRQKLHRGGIALRFC